MKKTRTKTELEALCSRQQEEIRQFALAIRILFSVGHATTETMHVADAQHVNAVRQRANTY